MNDTNKIFNETINNKKVNKYEAQAKWQKKVGLIAKSYKLKRDVADEFSAACNKAGISQAAQLTRMMKEFTLKMEQQPSKNENEQKN